MYILKQCQSFFLCVFLSTSVLVFSACSSYQEETFPSEPVCKTNCSQGRSLPYLGDPLNNLRDDVTANPRVLQIQGECFVSNYALNQQTISIFLGKLNFSGADEQPAVAVKCEHGRYFAPLPIPAGYLQLGMGYRVRGELRLGSGASPIATFEKTFSY